jgi:hypothetical protein
VDRLCRQVLFSRENSPEFLGMNEDLRSLGLAFLDLLVWKLILILFPFVVFMGKAQRFLLCFLVFSLVATDANFEFGKGFIVLF